MTPSSTQPGRPAPGTYVDLPPGLDPVYVRIYETALPMLRTRRGDVHACISCQFALEILEREGGDSRVAVPAVLLHDLGWYEVPEAGRRRAFGPNSSDAELNRLHEEAGARLARGVLEALGYDPLLTDEICRIIEGHDSRPNAETFEEAVVKDVDKIWRVSQAGMPVNLEILENVSAQEIHDFVAVRVPRWFLTDMGRVMVLEELAARREEYALQPPPDIPPPPGFGIGDVEEYSS